MATALFLFGFLPLGIVSAYATASLEPTQSDQAGALGFLLILCIAAAAISALLYAAILQRTHRRKRWFAALSGGVVAGGTFYASLSASDPKLWDVLRLGLGYRALLALVIPSLIGLLWPLLSAKNRSKPSHQL